MNHPTREDWMALLYDELAPERRAELDAHLKTCAACRSDMNAWRGTATALDAWTLPPAGGGSVRRRTFWTWTAAAALVLGMGVAVGRFLPGAGPDASSWRAEMTQEFDRKLAAARSELAAGFQQQQNETMSRLSAALDAANSESQRLLAEYTRDHEALRLEDKQVVITALRQLDLRYANSLAALRKELETVAVNTEDSFAETEQRLGQLASLAQPVTLEP